MESERLEALREDLATWTPGLSQQARGQVIGWVMELPDRPAKITVRMIQGKTGPTLGSARVPPGSGPVSQEDAEVTELRLLSLIEGADVGDLGAGAVSWKLDAFDENGGRVGGKSILARPAEPSRVTEPLTRESAQASMMREAAGVIRGTGEAHARVLDASAGGLLHMAAALGEVTAECRELREETRELRGKLADAEVARARAEAGQAPWEVELMRLVIPVLGPAVVRRLGARTAAPAITDTAAPAAAPAITDKAAVEAAWAQLGPGDKAELIARLAAAAGP